MKQRAVFLDRDGVLNHAIIRNGKPYSPTSVSELTIPEDVLSALQILKTMGYLLICVTNQPDVARGVTPKATVEAMHKKITSLLPLDAIRVCYHDDCDHCSCRKPLPGLLIQAAQDYSIDLKHSIMVGDRWKDIEAGQQAGCQTIWMNQGYEEPSPKEPPSFITDNMLRAANWIKQISQSELPS